MENRTFIMMNTIRMITTQYLMSEHSSDRISNTIAQPEKNTAQKKYLTRLIDHNHIDQLYDKESSPTDLPESWSHKELLHNRFKLINHGGKIIPMIYRHILREVHILSRPSNTCQNAHKELYILSSTVEIPVHAERSLHSFKTIN